MTLKEFINIFDMEDNEIIHLTDNNTNPQIYRNAPYYSIKDIRNKFDIRKIEVVKVETHHYLYETDICYRLTVKIKKMSC